MNIIRGYVSRSVRTAILYTLLVLLTLLILGAFVDEMADVGRGDFTTLHAFLIAVAGAPRYAFETFPIAALIGSLIALGGMASHSELTAMRAAGVSIRTILLAVMRVGLGLALLLMVFGELVAPTAEDWAQRLGAEKKQQKITLKTDYGFWALDGDNFVNIRRVLPGAQLQDIAIYNLDERHQLSQVIRADSGGYQDGGWVLRDIRRIDIENDGLTIARETTANWQSLLDPALLDVVLVQPSQLPIWDLYRYIHHMRANGQNATSYEVVFWNKIATPLATLVMLFLAVPVVFGSLRSVGIGQRLFVGVVLGAVFFLLTRAMGYSAVVYDLPPALTAILPGALFLLGGVVLLRRMG